MRMEGSTVKYNRSEIMRTAHWKHRRFGMTFAQALRLAWYEAKQAVERFNVYGELLCNGSTVLLASNVPYAQAEQVQFLHECRYDRITMKAV